MMSEHWLQMALALAGPPGKFLVGACEHRVLLHAPSKLAAVVYYGKEITGLIFGVSGFCGHLFEIDRIPYNGPEPWEIYGAMTTYENFKHEHGHEIKALCDLLEQQMEQVKILDESYTMVEVAW